MLLSLLLFLLSLNGLLCSRPGKPLPPRGPPLLRRQGIPGDVPPGPPPGPPIGHRRMPPHHGPPPPGHPKRNRPPFPFPRRRPPPPPRRPPPPQHEKKRHQDPPKLSFHVPPQPTTTVEPETVAQQSHVAPFNNQQPFNNFPNPQFNQNAQFNQQNQNQQNPQFNQQNQNNPQQAPNYGQQPQQFNQQFTNPNGQLNQALFNQLNADLNAKQNGQFPSQTQQQNGQNQFPLQNGQFQNGQFNVQNAQPNQNNFPPQFPQNTGFQQNAQFPQQPPTEFPQNQQFPQQQLPQNAPTQFPQPTPNNQFPTQFPQQNQQFPQPNQQFPQQQLPPQFPQNQQFPQQFPHQTAQEPSFPTADLPHPDPQHFQTPLEIHKHKDNFGLSSKNPPILEYSPPPNTFPHEDQELNSIPKKQTITFTVTPKPSKNGNTQLHFKISTPKPFKTSLKPISSSKGYFKGSTYRPPVDKLQEKYKYSNSPGYPDSEYTPQDGKSDSMPMDMEPPRNTPTSIKEILKSNQDHPLNRPNSPHGDDTEAYTSESIQLSPSYIRPQSSELLVSGHPAQRYDNEPIVAHDNPFGDTDRHLSYNKENDFDREENFRTSQESFESYDRKHHHHDSKEKHKYSQPDPLYHPDEHGSESREEPAERFDHKNPKPNKKGSSTAEELLAALGLSTNPLISMPSKQYSSIEDKYASYESKQPDSKKSEKGGEPLGLLEYLNQKSEDPHPTEALYSTPDLQITQNSFVVKSTMKTDSGKPDNVVLGRPLDEQNSEPSSYIEKSPHHHPPGQESYLYEKIHAPEQPPHHINSGFYGPSVPPPISAPGTFTNAPPVQHAPQQQLQSQHIPQHQPPVQHQQVQQVQHAPPGSESYVYKKLHGPPQQQTYGPTPPSPHSTETGLYETPHHSHPQFGLYASPSEQIASTAVNPNQNAISKPPNGVLLPLGMSSQSVQKTGEPQLQFPHQQHPIQHQIPQHPIQQQQQIPQHPIQQQIPQQHVIQQHHHIPHQIPQQHVIQQQVPQQHPTQQQPQIPQQHPHQIQQQQHIPQQHLIQQQIPQHPNHQNQIPQHPIQQQHQIPQHPIQQQHQIPQHPIQQQIPLQHPNSLQQPQQILQHPNSIPQQQLHHQYQHQYQPQYDQSASSPAHSQVLPPHQPYEVDRSVYSGDSHHQQSIHDAYKGTDYGHSYPVYLPEPDPIIEIIVQDSNMTLPAPPTYPPPPPPPPPTAEPVHVFYVKYSQNNTPIFDNYYGQSAPQGVQLEQPISSISVRGPDRNGMVDDTPPQAQYINQPPQHHQQPQHQPNQEQQTAESNTNTEQVSTTTLRTLIIPDRNHYSDTQGGLVVSFDNPAVESQIFANYSIAHQQLNNQFAQQQLAQQQQQLQQQHLSQQQSQQQHYPEISFPSAYEGSYPESQDVQNNFQKRLGLQEFASLLESGDDEKPSEDPAPLYQYVENKKLPEDVPEELRKQLVSSGILGNADVQVINYSENLFKELGDLPSEALAAFQAHTNGPESQLYNGSQLTIQSGEEMRKLFPQSRSLRSILVVKNSHRPKRGGRQRRVVLLITSENDVLLYKPSSRSIKRIGSTANPVISRAIQFTHHKF